MTSTLLQKAERESPVIDPGDEAPFLAWGGEYEALRCLTEAVQSAMLGKDVLLPETGEAHGQQEAPTAEHTSQKEDADGSARTSPGGGGRGRCTLAWSPGSWAAVLQRRALRRAAAVAPDAGRPPLASRPPPPPPPPPRAAAPPQRHRRRRAGLFRGRPPRSPRCRA